MPKNTIFFNDIKPQPTEWLWEPFIPMDKLTIVQGDPGCGKSTLLLNLAAAVTKGQQFPEKKVVSVGSYVLYQNAEDGLHDTVRPRLDAADADPEMVFTIDESEESLEFCDTEFVRAIQIHRPKLVVLDPLQAYLGGSIDMHRANEVRPAMKILAKLAETYHCAIVLIGHMNKMPGQNALYRGLGSIDIAAAARSVLLVGRHPHEPEKRVVMQIKNSIAEMAKPQCFTVREGKFVWLGECDLRETELLSAPAAQPSQLEKAMRFLKENLNEDCPEKPQHEIEELADSEDIVRATLYRAKKQLGIFSTRHHGTLYWHIPVTPPDPEKVIY